MKQGPGHRRRQITERLRTGTFVHQIVACDDVVLREMAHMKESATVTEIQPANASHWRVGIERRAESLHDRVDGARWQRECPHVGHDLEYAAVQPQEDGHELAADGGTAERGSARMSPRHRARNRTSSGSCRRYRTPRGGHAIRS